MRLLVASVRVSSPSPARTRGSTDVVVERSVFGLTTDGRGIVTGVCLLGTTLDPDAEFLSCIVERIQKASPPIPVDGPRLDGHRSVGVTRTRG